MIIGFEHITKPLNPDELNLVPKIISGFKTNHIGKENLISSKEIIRKMREKGYQINDSRLRKIINYIRAKGIAPICSNNKGYWYSVNVKEMKEEIESLNQRSAGIIAAAKGLNNFLIKITSNERNNTVPTLL